MKHKVLIICSIAVASVMGNLSARGEQPPASAEQLRAAFETALKAKDAKAAGQLVNGEGVSDELKTMVNAAIANLSTQQIVSVKLVPVESDFQLTNEINGIRYRPNVEVVGKISVEYGVKNPPLSMNMPYGKSGQGFYLSGTVQEKIPGPVVKSKSLSIMVTGSTQPDAANLSGFYVVVQNGKEFRKQISGKGNHSEAFWGDYIKSCTVQKDGSDSTPIQLTIRENDKQVFKSEAVTNNTPIVYEKK